MHKLLVPIVSGCRTRLSATGHRLIQRLCRLGRWMSARSFRTSERRWISVTLHDRIATVSGRVASASERRLLTAVVMAVPGVDQVSNELEVVA